MIICPSIGPQLSRKGSDVWHMGPCFVGGLRWCYNALMRIPNQGPMLEDHRIYFAIKTSFVWILVTTMAGFAKPFHAR